MVYLRCLCGDTPFWNSSLSWNTFTPSLTPCFLDTVLVYPQSAFLWLMLPYVFLVNRGLKAKPRLWYWNNLCKLLLAFLVTLLALAEFIYVWVYGSYQRFGTTVFRSHLLATGLTCITYALMLVYFYQQRYYGHPNCGPVWFYLFLQITCIVFSIIISDKHFYLHHLTLIGLILLFLLVSWAEPLTGQNSYKANAKPNPRNQASIPSKLVFWWYNSLIFLGLRRTLCIEDLWAIRSVDSSQLLLKCFNRHWRREPKDDQVPDQPVAGGNRPIRLSTALFKMFWLYFLFPSIARFLIDLLQLVNPIVLKHMILFTSDQDEPLWHGILYCVVFVLINVMASWVYGYHQNRMAVLGMRIKSCLVGAVYRKSLLLSPSSRQAYTSGEIINLMAVDSQRFLDMMPTFFYIYTAPVQVAITLLLLWLELGPAVFGGLALMVIFIPVNAIITGAVKKIQVKQMAEKDKRLKVITEMLNGIKVLKLYAWEEAFMQKIEKIRLKELLYIRKSGIVSAVFVIINECCSFMVTCLTFAIYILMDSSRVLTAERAFVSLALFNILRIPLSMIPNMLTTLILTMVSLKRLTRFINCDEVENYVIRDQNLPDAIQISNASFSWDGKRPILSEIELQVPKGSLVALVGSVGSGKSSFLSAILGDMQRHTGTVTINAGMRMAYVAQQAWIQNSTLRDNILFGSNYEHSRYHKVIEACALLPDLEMLPGGDFTEIGEKGINLSGGQKQRVSIARACYSNADLFLFDDPLSAVDSHVSKHIYERVLSSKTGILQSKTRVLVTNALYMLPQVDQIIFLNEGTVSAIGTYQQLQETRPDFAEMMSNYFNATTDNEPGSKLDRVPVVIPSDVSSDGDSKLSRSVSSEVKILSKQDSVEEKPIVVTKEQQSRLTEKETVESGRINWKVYLRFVQALSPWWFTLILFNYLMMITWTTVFNFWLSFWTEASERDPNADQHYYLLIYFILLLTIMTFAGVAWFCTINGILYSSRSLHTRLLSSLIHAPMSFFDTTPIGRIVNRFSRDIDILDNLQFFIRVFSKTGFRIVAIIFTISYETPIFLAFVAPFLIIYFLIQRYYVATTRQLKRLESVTRSPILNHFSETILGVSTIKAYGVTGRFVDEANHRVDENQRCFYPNALATCWLNIWLEFLSNCLIFIAALLAVLSKLWGKSLSGSETGLSLSHALWMTLALNWFVKMVGDLENNLVSVERVHEYSQVPPEAAWHSENDRCLVDSWPDQGAIVFHKYATRYRAGLDFVLRHADFTIQPGEKVGIVGRTGAGKSSLTLALFRIIEACEGDISIDGVNTTTLGLQKLRSRLTIIPQDPVLFSGTVRFNLDPFDQYSDEQLWHVLKLSHLKGFVDSLELGLSHPIAESGENVSVGQRQLICLARALLRRTPVLVLDEATAAVDHQTDSLIQSTIRSEFAHCTVLTIAHRLHTILDSDRVLVLNAGRIAEFDSPQALLADRHSIFHSLAKDAGIVPSMS